jgi:AcrR family transcriptional regulator
MKTQHKQSAKQPTRLGIIDAARSHIDHKGFGAASYANIAQETNLTKGNIQYHFKSKDELLQAVIDQQIAGIRQQLENPFLKSQYQPTMTGVEIDLSDGIGNF